MSIAVLGVNAQSSSGNSTSSALTPIATAGLTPCIITCLTVASLTSSGCKTFTNITCLCTNTKFQAKAGRCLSHNCTLPDRQAAYNFQQVQCGHNITSSSGSSTSTSASVTSPSATSPVSAATSNSAAIRGVQLGYGEVVGAVVALIGSIIGGGLVFQIF